MNTQLDPVFEGLATGLKPADLELAEDVISIDLELLRARERLRGVKATERLVDLAEETLAGQLRIAKAAERQAEALEAIAALFACVIQPVECADGETRCTLRVHERGPNPLSFHNT